MGLAFTLLRAGWFCRRNICIELLNSNHKTGVEKMFPELSDFSSLRQRVLDFLFFLLKPEMKYVGRIVQLKPKYESSENVSRVK